MSEVYLNGKFVGYVEHPEEFSRQIKSERRKGSVNANVNVFYDESCDEVNIFSLRGRARRPLIVVQAGRSMLTEKGLI